ncbi:exo-beta-N-acetylmuramidase NamZ domain-containing protein [Pseudactinotalea sp.]|uniref:exo-beta-N-acetylmuramidase NamZ family protein n=1 Tax=Pseudactinotalea sp. TaxID=1926260 RepID=UPI003B3B9B38
MTAAARSSSTGLEAALDDPGLLGPGPISLCANYTSVTEDLGRGVDALLTAGVEIGALLTPEHGYWGAVQAGLSEGDGEDPATGIAVLDTYGVAGEQLDALLCGAPEHIVVDLQDIGCRFYTYTWTLFDLLCAAARLGRRVTVLDRPNPLGGTVHGPGLEPACASFVGRTSIPLQHGLTLGELARWFASEHVPQTTGSDVDLTVVGMSGWHGQRQAADDTWVLPSPNMPTAATALLYPATGLLEGTTLSEGRGTTKPFQLCGAPWTDARFAAAMREHRLPGLAVREAVFRPTFHAFADQTVHGVQLHVQDADAFDPILTGWTLLSTVAELYPDQELWREHDPARPPFLDLLWGSATLREGIDSGASLDEVLAASPVAARICPDLLLYPRLEENP